LRNIDWSSARPGGDLQIRYFQRGVDVLRFLHGRFGFNAAFTLNEGPQLINSDGPVAGATDLPVQY
jgi:hypothetical protein